MAIAQQAAMQDPWPALRRAYAQARAGGATRHRDIAGTLGISEGELIAAHVGPLHNRPADGLVAHRLRGPWPALLAALEPLGEVMALTRNASCVHEKTGVYRQVSAAGPAGREVGLVLGGAIDLRVFYRHWAHGFAVDEPTPHGLQQSLQFFDAAGTATHKIFTRRGTDLDAWIDCRLAHLAFDQTPGLAPTPAAPRSTETPDTCIDVAALRQAWASLRDTHEFFPLLKAHGVRRTQALRLADPGYAQRVDDVVARELLHTAAREHLPIMVFAGNPGTIQIHTGPVHDVRVVGPWLNVMDADFNLHLREDHVEQAWAVRKPTTDGLVTSIELYDGEGESIAMFFGERKPGQPELCAWRRLVDALVSDPRWVPHDAGCQAC